MGQRLLFALVIASTSLSLALLVSLASIAQGQPGKMPPAAPPGPVVGARNQAPRSPADEARRSKVLAKVGEVTITIGHVEDGINAQSPFLRARYQTPDRLRQFVSDMVRFELLAIEATKRGYSSDPEVIKTLNQNMVQQLIRRDFDEGAIARALPAADVQAYYDEHPAEFNRAETVRASHIVVATQQEAQQLIRELRGADTRRFRELAREKSLDPQTKLRGGDLRYFDAEGHLMGSAESVIPASVVEAAMALREVGDLSPRPVRMGEQWSVIRLTGRRPADHRTLAQSDAGIRSQLARGSRERGLDELVNRLRENVQPEIFEERLVPIEIAEDPPTEGRPGFPGAGGPRGKAGKLGRPRAGPPRPAPTPPAHPAPAAPGPSAME